MPRGINSATGDADAALQLACYKTCADLMNDGKELDDNVLDRVQCALDEMSRQSSNAKALSHSSDS